MECITVKYENCINEYATNLFKSAEISSDLAFFWLQFVYGMKKTKKNKKKVYYEMARFSTIYNE